MDSVDDPPATVLTVTVNPALDVALAVEALVPNHKLRTTSYYRHPGGGGVNVSRVLRRLGVASDALVAVGGPTGDELVELLAADGIRAVTHPIAEPTRESISIRDLSRGDQYRVLTEGPTIDDPDAMADAILARAQHVEVVVLSGGLAPGLPDDFYAQITGAIGESAMTVVDCAGSALEAVTSGRATVVKPARRELAILVGWVPTDIDEIESAARQVLDSGSVDSLVVSLGPLGALLVERDGAATRYGPPPVDHVVSTVGAGDSMVGGMVSALLNGASIADACRRGVAAGTAAVLTPGTELCHVADVDRLEPDVIVL